MPQMQTEMQIQMESFLAQLCYLNKTCLLFQWGGAKVRNNNNGILSHPSETEVLNKGWETKHIQTGGFARVKELSL